MSTAQRTALLFITTKFIRMFGSGILVLVFVLSLHEKGHVAMIPKNRPYAYLVQASLYVGTMLTTSFLRKNEHRIGVKNILLIASILMFISSLVLTEYSNLEYLVVLGLLGMMPVVGKDLEIFTAIQEATLSQGLSKQQQQKIQIFQNGQKSFYLLEKTYKVIGPLAQILGIIIPAYFLQEGKKSVQTYDTIVVKIMRFSTILCLLHVVVYLLVDQSHLQTPKQKQTTRVLYNPEQLKQSIRPDSFLFITFLLFLGLNIFNFTSLFFYFHQKYEQQVPHFTSLIVVLIIVSHFGEQLAQKLKQNGYDRIALMVGVPINLMSILIGATHFLNYWQLFTFVANMLTNPIVFKFWQKMQTRLLTQGQLLHYHNKIQYYRRAGSTMSIVMFAIFCIFDPYTFQYSTSIVIGGSMKFIVSVTLLSCLSCLGDFSYSPAAPEEQQASSLSEQQGREQTDRLKMANTQ